MTELMESRQKIVHVNSTRLSHLDGMRGIAVLLVVLYHLFSNRWVEHLPYGDVYHHFFKFGNMGVQMFFIISGFVITMTLERCSGLGEFMYRRWLRLFPAMLIVSFVILATAPLFTDRPYGAPSLRDVIPGLTFIEPEFYRFFFSGEQGILEGSFWTLFVEAKFYLVAGFLYFEFGQKRMVGFLIAMFLTVTLFDMIKVNFPSEPVTTLNNIFHYLNYRHYGWFAAGALFYQYHSYKSLPSFILGIVVALISARGLGGLLSSAMVFATGLIFIFVGGMLSKKVQHLLSNEILVFFGFISYPLYLVHENAMISMVIQIHRYCPDMPPYLLPIFPVAVLVLIALVVAKYIEPALKMVIKNMMMWHKLIR